MQGSVRRIKRKRGYAWTAVVDLPRRENGGRRQKRRTFPTKREADGWLAKLNHEVQVGSYVEPSTLTLGELLERWVEDYGGAKLRKTTVQDYKAFIRNHIEPALGAVPLAKLSPLHIQQFYRQLLENGSLRGDKGLSASTIRYHIHAPLRRALQTAVEWQLITRNPADGVTAPRPRQKQLTWWSAEQVRVFLVTVKELASVNDATLFETAILTGLRRGELLGLRWQDIDFEASKAAIRQCLARTAIGQLVFQEPKTQSGKRTVSLPRQLVTDLRRHRADQAKRKLQLGPAWESSDLVFTNGLGGPVDPSNLWREFRRLTKKAGLPPISFHELRHTHATLLLEGGVHPKIVSERLGHSSVAITLDTYSHALPNLQEAAASQLAETLLSSKSVG